MVLPDDSSPSIFTLINSALLIIYILAQVIIYLVKKRKPAAEVARPIVKALQIDLARAEVKIVELDKLMDQQGIVINNKLDMIITQFDEQKQDFREMRRQHQDLNDRMIRMETLLNKRSSR